jgi:hypothetical protein
VPAGVLSIKRQRLAANAIGMLDGGAIAGAHG